MTPKLFLATLALALTAGTALADGPVPPSNIPVPKRGKAPADFAPPGWQLVQAASGDLDGDGLADAAMAFTAERPNEEGARWRLFVLARGERKGGLRLVWANPQVLPALQQSLPDGLGPLEVRDGALLLRRWGGETRVWLRTERDVTRVIRIDERWDLPPVEGKADGEAEGEKVWHPSGSTGAGREYDAVTGILEDSRPRGGEPRRTRMLLAPLVAAVPEEGAWPGLELALGPEDARLGSAPAEGPEDVAARIQAVTTGAVEVRGRFLEVRVKVQDDDLQPEDGLRLVTPDRKVLPPLEMKREPAPGGWVVRARWSVVSEDGDGAFQETFPEDPPFGRAADLALEVVDQDGGQDQETVLTTGLEGKDGASILLLDADPGAPGLFEMLKIKGC